MFLVHEKFPANSVNHFEFYALSQDAIRFQRLFFFHRVIDLRLKYNGGVIKYSYWTLSLTVKQFEDDAFSKVVLGQDRCLLQLALQLLALELEHLLTT